MTKCKSNYLNRLRLSEIKFRLLNPLLFDTIWIITIIPYHYVQYICKWFMVQVSVGIDLVTIGFIGLLSVHHMLNCILTFIS